MLVTNRELGRKHARSGTKVRETVVEVRDNPAWCGTAPTGNAVEECDVGASGKVGKQAR